MDRYRRFAEAMAEADPSIRLLACGSPVLTGDAWNRALIRGGGRLFTELADHVLLGSGVGPDADPLDVYRDFLALPAALEGRYRGMHELMLQAGIERPRIAITELQLFARIRGEVSDPGRRRLTPETLVGPATLAEALYDTLLYHVAARLAPLIEIITHSATVNHGGGLRKERERVYANPCYYARSLFSAFLGASPVLQELECGVCRAPGVLADLRESGFQEALPLVDSLAAVDGSGDVLVSLVHRGTEAPVEVELELEGLDASSRVGALLLGSARPWDANSLEQPERIRPARTTARLRAGRLRVELPPFALLHLRVGAASSR